MHTQNAATVACHLIDPTSIQASWAHGTLAIRIRGVVNEYPSGVTIQEQPTTIFPPEFAALDCVPDGIIGPVGHFPYDVTRLFPRMSYIETLMMRTSAGTRPVRVERLSSATSEDDAAGAPSILRRELNERQAIGFSLATINIDSAISDATGKLQQRFPAKVHAKLLESGVVAVGQPLGISYAYALLEQLASEEAQPGVSNTVLTLRPERSGPIRSAQPGGLLMTGGSESTPRSVVLDPQLLEARQAWEALPVDGGYLLKCTSAMPAQHPLFLTVNPIPGMPGLLLAPLMGHGMPEQIFELLPNPGNTQVMIKSRMVGSLVTAASDKASAPVFLRPAEQGKIPLAQLWYFGGKAS